jgi:hypothetical protein
MFGWREPLELSSSDVSHQRHIVYLQAWFSVSAPEMNLPHMTENSSVKFKFRGSKLSWNSAEVRNVLYRNISYEECALQTKWHCYLAAEVCMLYLSILLQLVRTHMKGTQTWMLQKEKNAEWRECFILKGMYFSANNDNAIAWKYIDLRCSAVWWF